MFAVIFLFVSPPSTEPKPILLKTSPCGAPRAVELDQFSKSFKVTTVRVEGTKKRGGREGNLDGDRLKQPLKIHFALVQE